MDEQRGHFLIGEAERLQHDGPIDAVRGDEDVLADDVERWPEVIEPRRSEGAKGRGRLIVGSVCGRRSCSASLFAASLLRGSFTVVWVVAGGVGDVVYERVEPHVGDEARAERLGKRDAPLQPRRRARNAEVAFEFFHGVAQLGDAEIRDDERLSVGAALVNEVEQPLLRVAAGQAGRVVLPRRGWRLSEAEVEVLLVALLDDAPLGAELPVGAALLVREELLLPHAVKSALRLFVNPPALARRGVLVVPELLQIRAHTFFVERVGRRRPSAVFHVELLPQRGEFLRDAVHIRLRFEAGLFRALLHLLPVLVHAGEVENLLRILRVALQPVIAREHVGEHLFVSVADVRRAVGVINRGGDEKGLRHGTADDAGSARSWQHS